MLYIIDKNEKKFLHIRETREGSSPACQQDGGFMALAQ